MASESMSLPARVFEILELASIICSFADHRDCARLLRVRRCLFPAARPFVWRHVPGVIHLLRLMPGMLDHQASKGMLLVTVDITRLIFYAPFVESLEISRVPAKRYYLHNPWRAIPFILEPIIFLPNLRRLSYTSPGPIDNFLVDWLQVFLSPSVRHIEVSVGGASPLWLDVLGSSRVLRTITRLCPKLECLRIYPGDPVPNTRYRDDEGLLYPEEVVFANDKYTIHRQMKRCQNLRNLTISPAILEPITFYAISTLPYLDSLIIQSTGDGGPLYSEYYRLTDTSFPSLRHLSLMFLDPHVAESLCELEPLVCRLTNASIVFDEEGDDVEVWDFHGSRQDILQKLGTRSRLLTHLVFRAGSGSPGIILTSSFLDMLRVLPLRYLELDNMNSMSLEARCADMLDALPCIEELHLPADSVQHTFLRHAATRLPRLRYLELGAVNFDHCNTSNEFAKPPNQPQTPLQIQCEFNMGGRPYDVAA
ncbi:hypothetical protein FS749_013317 [Ceratobasidium sp. UAMH 11750]|nr:hypothetical protein FS749_013317 [Ceratobasidium sp. UAMH 11750]